MSSYMLYASHWWVQYVSHTLCDVILFTSNAAASLSIPRTGARTLIFYMLMYPDWGLGALCILSYTDPESWKDPPPSWSPQRLQILEQTILSLHLTCNTHVFCVFCPLQVVMVARWTKRRQLSLHCIIIRGLTPTCHCCMKCSSCTAVLWSCSEVNEHSASHIKDTQVFTVKRKLCGRSPTCMQVRILYMIKHWLGDRVVEIFSLEERTDNLMMSIGLHQQHLKKNNAYIEYLFNELTQFRNSQVISW